jgi:ribonucleoside-diphosphate reductase alpha chain
MLAALNLRYGSEEATQFSEELHKIMAVASYTSSIELAKERGCFPIWDGEKEIDNPFLDRIYKELDNCYQLDWGLYGRRNIANLTIAPTGSVSILTQTTSGIEPCFKVYYKRRRKINDKFKATFVDEQGDMWEEYRVFHHKFVEWFKIRIWNDLINMSDRFAALGKTPLECLNNLTKEQLEEFVVQSPYYKATSSDVDYLGKVELQGRVQMWIDHSISVTVNMPKEATEEMVSQVYMKAYTSGCKGVTVYREGSRNGVLISDDSKDKQSTDIVYNDAPKRPETLKCDVYSMSRGKQAYTIIVGLLESGKPYEIFALEKLSNVEFSDKIAKGKLRKVKSRTYELIGFCNTTKYVVDNILDHMSQDEQKDTRKYSIQLRHGIHPKHVINQINEYASITSFDKVVSKALSNYLGEEKLKGEEVCPNCGGELKYEGGCVQCINPECGWSKCS